MPKSAANAVIVLAAIHVLILLSEMFMWNWMGPRMLGSDDPDLLRDTTVMAANQGLYNGFLAAGLFWSLMITDPTWQRRIALFFVICIAVAGLYGFYSTQKFTILLAQTIPAGIALVLMFFGSKDKAHAA